MLISENVLKDPQAELFKGVLRQNNLFTQSSDSLYVVTHPTDAYFEHLKFLSSWGKTFRI